MELDDVFWNETLEEMRKGYLYDIETDEFICLLCGRRYIKGVIYPYKEVLLEAEKRMKIHITEEDGSIFEYFLNMNKRYTGITDHQKELLGYFYNGLSDKEIGEQLGGISTSTIRNHRFKLREKEKQAKVYLTLMSLLDQRNVEEKNEETKLIHIHKGATMIDERYAISEKEKNKVLETYFKDGLEGRLSIFPSKEKRKIIILQHIMNRFEGEKRYKEKEVDEVLKEIYEDYVTIRRYLIEYGFMKRSKDGSEYWVNH